MESETMKKFNAELAALRDDKNLSKAKIQEITKAALKAKANYKQVVHNIERLLTKIKPDQRLGGLYVIDSIVRASKHQLKERDVFGPRVLKQFDKMLEVLLKCGRKEKLRTIRTLNLWMSNKVFTEAEIQPFRDKCSAAGLGEPSHHLAKKMKEAEEDMSKVVYSMEKTILELQTQNYYLFCKVANLEYAVTDLQKTITESRSTEITDFEEVEKAVKGPNADMSIYDGAYKKKAKKNKPRTPPFGEDGLLGAGPSGSIPIPNFILSEEIVNGTISEREMMELALKFGIDRDGLLAKDRELLKKTLMTFIASLQVKITERQNEERKKNENNIQNMLTKDFEYSDDEEEKEKDQEDKGPKQLTHDEILGLASNLLSTPFVIAQLREIITGKPAVKKEVPVEVLPPNLAGFGLGQPPNLLALQGLSGFPAQQLGISGFNPALLSMQNQQNAMLLQQRIMQQQIPVSQQNLMMMNSLINPFGLPPGVNPLLSSAAAAPPGGDSMDIEENSAMEGNTNGNEDSSKSRSKESRERRKMGLPSVKPGFTIIASKTLWLKKIPANVTENELKQSIDTCSEVERVKIIGNRACAYITMYTRRGANEVTQKMREVSIAKKMVKVYWARSPGLDTDKFADLWDSNRGIWEIPYERLPPDDLVSYCEGAVLDLESLPENRKGKYKENGEKIAGNPAPAAIPPLPTPQPPPPLGFPFPVGLAPFNGAPGFNGAKPAQPGVPPMLNLGVPPPPGMPGMAGFPPAPPPPGVGPPPIRFDPNKPPPMFQQGFPPSGPRPPPFGRGNGMMMIPPPFGRGGGPPPFRGGRGGGPPGGPGGPPPPMFQGRGPPPRPDLPDRGRLMDQNEAWKEHQQGERRNREENGNGSRRRVSRWGDESRGEPRRSGGSDMPRRRSPMERRGRSPSTEKERWEQGQPEVKKTTVDDETVSSTTITTTPPVAAELPIPVIEAPKVVEQQEDKTDEVPMDLE